ncbi:MAG: outer membrane beta-barrel protein [bacterium]|nr:outer membrane beta-barrel protein [bacterium]
MRILLVLSAMLVFTGIALSEQSTLGVNLSLGIPVGDFASTTNDEAGMALTGVDIGLDYTNPWKENLYWGLLINLGSNAVDKSPIEKDLPGAKVTVDYWSHLLLMAKGGRSFKISDNLAAHGEILLGIMRAATPEIKAETSTLIYTQSSGSGSSVAYGFGGNIIYKNRLDLGLKYCYGNPEFKLESYTGNKYTIHQHTSLVFISVGYLFHL